VTPSNNVNANLMTKITLNHLKKTQLNKKLNTRIKINQRIKYRKKLLIKKNIIKKLSNFEVDEI